MKTNSYIDSAAVAADLLDGAEVATGYPGEVDRVRRRLELPDGRVAALAVVFDEDSGIGRWIDDSGNESQCHDDIFGTFAHRGTDRLYGYPAERPRSFDGRARVLRPQDNGARIGGAVWWQPPAVEDVSEEMRLDDLHDMTRGYITAALWTDAIPLEANDSDDWESGGLEGLEVRAEDYCYVFALCERFARAAGAALVVYADLRAFQPSEGSVWSYIGHDLRLTSAGHGTGFWDREPEPTNMREGDGERFAAARAELSELARQSPYHRDGGGDVWQHDADICHLDWWSLEPTGPGEVGPRWTPPDLSSAQRQAWIEEGVVPTPEEMPEAETRVVVRRFADGGDLIALFPDHDEGGGRIGSYMRIGQHGPASRSVVDCTRPVDYEEADVQSLVRELRAVGYVPRLVKRLTR